MNIEKVMFKKAVDFLNERYGENKAGGVAVILKGNKNYGIYYEFKRKSRT